MSLYKRAQELRQQRAEILRESRALLDKAEKETRNLNGDEQQKFSDLHTRQDSLRQQIERIEAQRAAEETPAAVTRAVEKVTGVPPAEQRTLAITGWMIAKQGGELREAHEEAMRACNVRASQPHLDLLMLPRAPKGAEQRDVDSWIERETRAMSSLVAAKGGILAPPQFMSNLERALLTFGGVRQVAEIIRTDHGNTVEWPTINDTTNKGRRVNEAGPTAAATDPAFKGFTLGAYKYTSDVLQAPVELLEDTAFDVVALIGDLLGERVSRALNTDFTVGDGALKPQGIVTGSIEGKEAASQTAFTPGEIIDFFHSVDPAYRGTASWMLHDKVLSALRQLKGTDVYFFQPSFTEGEPDMILGKPYVVNNDMDDALTQSKKVMLFGALSSYKVRDVRAVRLRRLSELYAENDMEGFVLFTRHDGALKNAGTNPVKHFTMKKT